MTLDAARTVIWCDCGTDAIIVEHLPEFGDAVELAMWSKGVRGDSRNHFGWRQRLRGAQQWLRGRPYTDVVLLDPLEAERLRQALAPRQEMANEDN